MLSILGIGAAYPETIIDNSLLAELSDSRWAKDLEGRLGILKRRSSLTIDYIRQTKNLNPRSVRSEISPSALGLQAAEKAIERAGIQKEQIGLILGDSGTPLETTPSEAQRLGALLGLKINAYDIAMGGGALLGQLDVLCNMKPESLPEYILCVSTNCLTQKVDYAGGDERFIFGDGACAFVASAKHSGKLGVHYSVCAKGSGAPNPIVVPSFGHISGAAIDEDGVYQECVDAITQLSKVVSGVGGSYLVGPQLSNTILARISEEFGIPSDKVLGNLEERGNTLGSSTMSVVAEHWDALKHGDQVVVVDVGLGLNRSSAVFRVM